VGINNQVKNGVFTDRTLAELTSEYPEQILGIHVANQHDGRFPLLIKLLDCENWLSLQVHPKDEQAWQLEGPQFVGKFVFASFQLMFISYSPIPSLHFY
jgi:mannose-6-phosphate isomerase